MHAGAGKHDSPKLLVGLAEINDPRVLMGSGSLVQVWVVSGRPMLISIGRGESWRFPFKVSARPTCGRPRARADLGRVGRRWSAGCRNSPSTGPAGTGGQLLARLLSSSDNWAGVFHNQPIIGDSPCRPGGRRQPGCDIRGEWWSTRILTRLSSASGN